VNEWNPEFRIHDGILERFGFNHAHSFPSPDNLAARKTPSIPLSSCLQSLAYGYPQGIGMIYIWFVTK
jgi:hypothetical protein